MGHGRRSQSTLEEVSALVANATVLLITADSHDEESLAALVSCTKVILTTVGPNRK